jgi:hypothetical protein
MTERVAGDDAAERKARRLWLVVLAIACGLSFPFLSRMMNANERPRLLQAIAIVDHGTVAIDRVVARGIDPGIDVSRAPAEHGAGLLPNKPPGATVPAVVAYVLLRAQAAVTGATPDLATLTLLARLLGAWLPTVLLAWSIARRSGDDATGRATATIVVLATPMAAYAHVLFGHALAALCLWQGTAWLLDASGESARPRHAFVGGLVAALAVTVEYQAVFAAIPLGVVVLREPRHRRMRCAAAIAGALVPIAALAAYHQAAFGSPWATGYHQVVDRGFAEIHGRGLLGLTWPTIDGAIEDLVSPHGGLLYWAPVVAFVPFVRRELRDGSPAVARVVTTHAAILATMIVVTLLLAQQGGWRVGPRYLVLALPAMAPALALLLRRWAADARKQSHVAILAGVVVASTVTNALAANLFPTLVPTGNPLRDQLIPLLQLGLAPYSALGGFVGAPPGSVWIAIGLPVLLVVHAMSRVVQAHREARRIVLAAAVVCVALAGAAWSVPPAPDAESTLASVVQIWEPAPEGSRPPRRVDL